MLNECSFEVHLITFWPFSATLIGSMFQEEKKRSEDLNRLLRDERAKVNSLGIGLEEESKRSLAMEEELERSMHQVRNIERF